jgi:Flp pilus assembly protein TadB
MANPTGSLADQILANRQKTWNGLGRLLFWGTIYAVLLALITALHAVFGPSWGLGVPSAIVIVVGFIAVVAGAMRS